MKISDRLSNGLLDTQASPEIEKWVPNFNELVYHFEVVGFSQSELEEIKQLGILIDPYLDEVLWQFVAKLHSMPGVGAYLKKNCSMEVVKMKLTEQVKDMLSGDFKKNDFQKTLVAGKVYEKNVMRPHWYWASFHMLQNGLVDLISNVVVNREDASHYIRVLLKVFYLKQQTLLSEFHEQPVQGSSNESDRVNKEIKTDIGTTSQNLQVISQNVQLAMRKVKQQGEQAANAMEQSERNASATQLLAVAGREESQRLGKEMQQIKSRISDVQQLFRVVKESSWEVIEIIDIVKTLSDNINLLALRVEAEAIPFIPRDLKNERAAREIQNLSDDTKESIFRMIQLIRLNHRFVDGMVQTLTIAEKQMELGMESSRQTKGTFNKIIASMDENLQLVEDTTEAIEMLLEEMMYYQTVIEDIAVTVEELNETASRL
ncbi:methyl-accepting chemotaxis protein [Sporosarcina sp. NCCP-2222]|uniref:globin-coupled sensor protein n=1 Tax=Sporosarcina sp. NCCP-2222 TaxID=2935073 RepID=UPI00207D838F|nr:globin-coupled sensor protein [Sporosarcina sp. NCCP-2222]GKV56685.1 methyl-accepting chemotaxis protein [Sporosarcina sp. NCCP-2222]